MIFKRPAILLTFGVLMLGLGIINSYNPVYTFIFGFGGLDFSGILNSIVSFLNLFTSFLDSPVAIIKSILIVAGIIVIVSFISAIFLSAAFNIINKTIDGKPQSSGDFREGIKKFYFKIVFIVFRVLFLGILFMLFLMVAAVPAIVITQSWISGKTGLFASAIILDIITVLALFFIVVFFTTYILFWFPAAVNGGEKSFIRGKGVADTAFWEIAKRLIRIVLVFIIYQGIMLLADRLLIGTNADAVVVPVILFIVNWVLNTLFSSFQAVYIFCIFKYIAAKSMNNIKGH
jgi:hypothetical protein